MRKTKIVSTIGPASNSPEQIKALLAAGTNVIRINLSHNQNDLSQTVESIQNAAAELKQPVAILADLQGPKIRIGRFKEGAVNLKPGQFFNLTCDLKHQSLGDEHGVSVDYPPLCKDLSPEDHLLLDDGLIELKVETVSPDLVTCRVIEGGKLSNFKGINRRGGGLNAGAMTQKDEADLKNAVKAGVDYIALSFVKDAQDVIDAKALLHQLNANKIRIIAKIERTEALDHLQEIIDASDGIMVARGDLAVEVGPAEVPGIQKEIIRQTQQLNKLVITATQMMESMITHPTPTRAEVSDVANAILDGTDAVMLSAETASGKYPVKVVEMVHKVCLSAEKHPVDGINPKSKRPIERPDLAIARACHHISSEFPVQAMVALTESGASAIWMSRQSNKAPVFAISDNHDTVRLLCLAKNVYPIYYDYSKIKSREVGQTVLNHLIDEQLIQSNEYILLTRGSQIGQPGGTNRLEIIKTD